jgi:hypothetical protein
MSKRRGLDVIFDVDGVGGVRDDPECYTTIPMSNCRIQSPIFEVEWHITAEIGPLERPVTWPS